MQLPAVDIKNSETFFMGGQLGQIFSALPKKRSDYYAFGLEMDGRSSNVSNPDDVYKYTGHERDNEAGLDLTYAGARYLDPVTGIWLSIDPKVDDYPGWSPYNYSLNNPVNLIDPDGEAPTDWVRNSDTGVYEWRNDVFSEDDAPEGYEYVGKGQADIQAHYNENTSFWDKLFGSGPEIDASNLGATLIQFDAMRYTTSLSIAENPLAWAASGPVGYAKTAKGFFDGASFSGKVLRQMNNSDDLIHAFPKSVEGFATEFSQYSTRIGGDGKVYQWLELSGSYKGKEGVFEFIKDSKGIINHRFFNTAK